MGRTVNSTVTHLNADHEKHPCMHRYAACVTCNTKQAANSTTCLAEQEMGASFEVGDIPADLADSAAEWREKLLEQVVELDDAVMEKYLDVSHPPAPGMIKLYPCVLLQKFLKLQPF